ncbi:MAG: hypothetical protein DMD35_11820 [Gemmatimonadetes bacterium]|nr:MAG: hypothetical protein DMD35_11820 [Gemmatimonadota bacterium]
MTARAIPTIKVAVAAMSPASGVKSAVTSMRSPRGRTPTPVDRRFAASSITGAKRTCVNRYASRAAVRPFADLPAGTSNETL